jgi:hypothetical protein
MKHLRTEIRPYNTVLRETKIAIPNIPTEIWEINGKEEVVYSADACDMIDNGILAVFPDFNKRAKKSLT